MRKRMLDYLNIRFGRLRRGFIIPGVRRVVVGKVIDAEAIGDIRLRGGERASGVATMIIIILVQGRRIRREDKGAIPHGEHIGRRTGKEKKERKKKRERDVSEIKGDSGGRQDMGLMHLPPPVVRRNNSNNSRGKRRVNHI